MLAAQMQARSWRCAVDCRSLSFKYIRRWAGSGQCQCQNRFIISQISCFPVAPDEARASFTQYAPGGLFRYVDYGFRLEGGVKKQDPKLHRAMMQARQGNWTAGLLLSGISELRESIHGRQSLVPNLMSSYVISC
ncbi:hypothetical protein BJ912DRAFT_159615 [Pholiota molesta]|nr:hypothetical protein BJ912DRAFT_159615 [Pholiota molesta]